MKYLLLTTIAAVLVVGCGPSEADKALLYAASKGHIEAVKHHLEAGADVNARDAGGMTPLHYTTLGGHKEIAELLIAKGANMNTKNAEGKTPLDSAIQLKRTETADLLRKHGGKTKKELEAGN